MIAMSENFTCKACGLVTPRREFEAHVMTWSTGISDLAPPDGTPRRVTIRMRGWIDGASPVATLCSLCSFDDERPVLIRYIESGLRQICPWHDVVAEYDTERNDQVLRIDERVLRLVPDISDILAPDTARTRAILAQWTGDSKATLMVRRKAALPRGYACLVEDLAPLTSREIARAVQGVMVMLIPFAPEERSVAFQEQACSLPFGRYAHSVLFGPE